MQPLPPSNRTDGGSELGLVNLSHQKSSYPNASRRELLGAENSEKGPPLRSSSSCDTMTEGLGVVSITCVF
jgi:hypothetical protein